MESENGGNVQEVVQEVFIGYYALDARARLGVIHEAGRSMWAIHPDSEEGFIEACKIKGFNVEKASRQVARQIERLFGKILDENVVDHSEPFCLAGFCEVTKKK